MFVLGKNLLGRDGWVPHLIDRDDHQIVTIEFKMVIVRCNIIVFANYSFVWYIDLNFLEERVKRYLVECDLKDGHFIPRMRSTRQAKAQTRFLFLVIIVRDRL